jgi:hypothetical protein
MCRGLLGLHRASDRRWLLPTSSRPSSRAMPPRNFSNVGRSRVCFKARPTILGSPSFRLARFIANPPAHRREELSTKIRQLVTGLSAVLPDHPDVRALALTDDAPAMSPLSDPPMVSAGVKLAQHHAMVHRGTIVLDSLIDCIAGYQTMSGPWTAWRLLERRPPEFHSDAGSALCPVRRLAGQPRPRCFRPSAKSFHPLRPFSGLLTALWAREVIMNSDDILVVVSDFENKIAGPRTASKRRWRRSPCRKRPALFHRSDKHRSGLSSGHS